MRVKSIIIGLIVALCGYAVPAWAAENDDETLAPLVPPPVWTGTIEVFWKKDVNPKPETEKKDYVIAWATAAKGGEVTTSHEEHSYTKIKITIKKPSAGESDNRNVAGTVEHRYSRINDDRRIQNSICRPKGGNSYIGQVVRTETVRTYTPNAIKGAVIKADFGAGDVLTSIKWERGEWHIVLFAKSKRFETEKETQQVTVSCNGEPFGDPPRQIKSDIYSDQIELDIDTRMKNEKAKALSGGAVVSFGGKEYNVSWNLMLK